MAQAALITGAAKRIGADLALFLAALGYDIALHYHRSENAAREVQIQIEKLGQKCTLFQADLSQTTDIINLLPAVLTEFPALSALLNNASVYPPVGFKETTPDIFDHCFQVHVKAPYFLSQAFARKVAAGNIINFVDTQVRRNPTGRFAYQLSKQTLLHLTEMCALELAPAIRVNGIAPGKIIKPVNLGPEPPDFIPLNRIGTFKDIRRAVQFLLEHDYLTGQIIYVDGGQTL